MGYRTIELAWHPRTTSEWATFSASRQEAARLWNDLIVRHHRIRRLSWKWPSKARWQRWAKGRYAGLSAQSALQIIGEFCEAVDSCRQLCKNGHMEAGYPWKLRRYRDVIYTNQDARIREGRLILPHGKSGALRIRLPNTGTLPGRLMEVRLSYGLFRLICEVADAPRPQQTVIGVDLGVNTLIAATNGHKVTLISGRAAKATIQYRNKQLARLQQAQSVCTKHSRRYKRLQRRKYAMLGKTKRRIRDLCHKAARQVAQAFPNATCFVGEPFNDAAQRVGRIQAQQLTLCPEKSRRFLVPPIGATPRFATTCRSPTLPKRSAQRLVSACPAVPNTGWLIEQVLVHHEGHSSPDCSRGLSGLFSVSTACTRKLIQLLDYKTAGAITLSEAYSSQTCPVCGERSKHCRIYQCPHCGATAPCDAVGALNILSLGQYGAMLPGRSLPQQVKYLRPWLRHPRSSSGGHPARSSV
jgi:transposase